MDQGWIKLYRKSIESRVFQNEGLWKVWTWCLLKVNHSNQWASLRTGRGSIEIECQRGQFIFGRLSAAKELKMNPTTVWKRIQKLKNMGNIDIESNSQYSLITLLSMAVYQPTEIKSDSKSDRQVTGKEQASDTNKNEKNEKKKNKTLIPKDFSISEGVIKWAEEKAHTNLEEHLENFKIVSVAKGYTYTNWDCAFKNAVRNNWAKLKEDNMEEATPEELAIHQKYEESKRGR